MEKIAFWCKAVSLVSVVSTVFLMIIPDSKSKATFKKLLSFLMIFVILYPLYNEDKDAGELFEFDFSLNSEQYEKTAEEFENYPIIKASESEIEKYTDNLLDNYGLKGESKAECRYEDGKLSVIKIIIFGTFDESDKIKIKEAVDEITDEKTEIIFEGEKNG